MENGLTPEEKAARKRESNKASVQRYQAKNKEAIRARAKERYRLRREKSGDEVKDAAEVEKIRAEWREYRRANKEKIRERDKAHREKNKDYYDAYKREWVAKNRDSLNARRRGDPKKLYRTKMYELKKKYNISPDQWHSTIKAQGDRCLCCKTLFGILRETKPCVDHCHSTGRVRGILCGRCNLLLGHANDQPAILRACARYLKQFASNDAEEA